MSVLTGCGGCSCSEGYKSKQEVSVVIWKFQRISLARLTPGSSVVVCNRINQGDQKKVHFITSPDKTSQDKQATAALGTGSRHSHHTHLDSALHIMPLLQQCVINSLFCPLLASEINV